MDQAQLRSHITILVSGRLKALLKEYWIPAVTGILPLIPLFLTRAYLLGQDGFTFFVNPLSGALSPFVPYNLMEGPSFSFLADQTYPTLAAYVLEWLGSSPQLAEKLILLFGTEVGTFGAFLLFGRLDKINGAKSRASSLVTLVPLGLYVFNPYTISVVWWHFAPWTFEYFVLPWVLLVGLEALYNTRVSPRLLSVALAVTVLMNTGVFAAYFVSLLLIVALTIGFLVGRWLLRVYTTRDFVKRLLFTCALILATLWSNLAFVLQSATLGLAPQSPYLTNGSGGQLASDLIGSSSNSSLLNVLRLEGYLRLSPQFGSLYYAWYSYYPVLAVVAVALPLTICLGLLVLRRVKGVAFLAVSSVFAIALAAGAAPPVGTVNLWLVQQTSVASVLLGAYYYFVGWYVLAGCCFAYLICTRNSNGSPARTLIAPTEVTSHPTSGNSSPGRRSRAKRQVSRAWLVSSTGIGLTLLVLASSSVPFLTGTEFATGSPNAVEVTLPDSFAQLSSFVRSNYSGPLFNVLVLPMSAIAGYSLEIGGASYLETSHLLAQLLGYPVIQDAAAGAGANLESLFAQGTELDLLPILQVLHIRFVVVNPYANTTAWFMKETPSGVPINWTHIEGELNSTVGLPIQVGSFEVHSISPVAPLAYVTGRNPLVSDPTYSDFLEFLATSNPASVPSNWTTGDSVWSPQSDPLSSGATLTPISPFVSNSLPQCPRCSDWAELTNGTLVSLSSVANSWITKYFVYGPSGPLSAKPLALFNVTDASSVTTDFNYSGGVWHENGSGFGFLDLPSFENQLSAVEVNLTLAYLGFSAVNQVTVNLSSGDVYSLVTIYQDFQTDTCALLLSAYSQGQVYAINNSAYGSQCAPMTGSVRLTLEASDTHVFAIVRDTQSGAVLSNGELGLTKEDANTDGFHNVTLAPTSSGFESLLRVNMTASGPSVALSNINASSSLPISHFLLVDGAFAPEVLNADVSSSSTGFEIRADATNLTGLWVILAEPSSPDWYATSGGAPLDLVSATNVSSVWVANKAIGAPSEHVDLIVAFKSTEVGAIAVSVAELVGVAVVAAFPQLVRRRRTPRSSMGTTWLRRLVGMLRRVR